MHLTSGRLHILLDGQFGSTGKGLLAAYLATASPCDLHLATLSPNAGHTFPWQGGHAVVKQLPVGGVLHDRSTIYLTAGSVLDVELLAAEAERFAIDRERLCVHPRAALIEPQDVAAERDPTSSVARIASTQSGVGAAAARKVLRQARLAGDCERLARFAQVKELDVMGYLEHGCSALLETCQGFDLGIDSGLSYPHCTSRDLTVSAALAGAQVHPSYLGQVAVSLRTFPIRVGHLRAEDGTLIGDSGPFYPDSRELTWPQLGVPEELTTVTKRVRRVASFSLRQYARMLHNLRPDLVFLNFANYVRPDDLELFRQAFALRCPELLGFGPTLEAIYPVSHRREAMELLRLSAAERSREHLLRKRTC